MKREVICQAEGCLNNKNGTCQLDNPQLSPCIDYEPRKKKSGKNI